MLRSQLCPTVTLACHGDAHGMLTLIPFTLNQPEHIALAAQIWSAACGPDLAITPRFVAYNLRPRMGKLQAGQVAYLNGVPVGFVIASTVQGDPKAVSANQGHIDAIAVLPEWQRHGIGAALLTWAESWLRRQNCTRLIPGASFTPFVPGIPVELGSPSFFERMGYRLNTNCPQVVDMASDLHDYVTPATAVKAQSIQVRPAREGDESALLDFLRREFPGGWRYECEQMLREGMRISDYVLLWSERGVDGSLLVTFEDSDRPLDRVYPYRLAHPWGHLGQVGISADRRGAGYGAALVDGGLRHLRDGGVRGCVIDWLVLVDFYAKFGFSVYRSYAVLAKEMHN